MSDHSTDWTKEEFHCYLLVYFSRADLVVKTQEQDFIRSRFPMELYDRMETEFDGDNDYQSIQKIKHAYDRLGYQPSEIGVIHNELMGLFASDGEVDTMERSMMNTLERILR